MIGRWLLAVRKAWRRFNGTEEILEELRRTNEAMKKISEESRQLAGQAHNFLEAAKKERAAFRKGLEEVGVGTKDNW